MALLALFLLSIIVCAASAKEEPCPAICTLDYRPVCASDGVETRTFGNACALRGENCFKRKNFRKLHDGECPK
ncbi:unnamed protein product [Hermetia illucens]|uniref:Kazal-like domain-containing protein n=1 Tax=Hermetia illucens TaxID=343691 RepID=A0A7R8UIS8_HERIL|nr:PI-actitoxin-Avd5a-like isoform X2 [Hermetia illucens]CAD7081327.1 unnamed protein product [Hermetia illucens]